MSTRGDDAGDKTLDPTEKKLKQAREKGDIVKSQDISVAASYFGLAGALVFAGPIAVEQVSAIMAQMIGQADSLSQQLFAGNGRQQAFEFTSPIIFLITPIFAVPILAVLLSIAAQRGFVFTPDKLMPKLSRISPISIAKNKFGRSGLFEFGKNLVKLFVISVFVGFFVSLNISDVLGSIFAPPATAAWLIVVNLMNLLWLVFIIALVISVADYFWQAYDHKRKLMMSRQDILDETKDSEGDPYLKQERKQRGYDIATQRMMADVPLADVVIVNPQHFAVALKWNRNQDSAPICVAKGVDNIAAGIRRIASEAGVPIHRDPPTARAIYSVIDLGQEVQPEHYKAVAAAIRFAEKMRGLAQR